MRSVITVEVGEFINESRLVRIDQYLNRLDTRLSCLRSPYACFVIYHV